MISNTKKATHVLNSRLSKGKIQRNKGKILNSKTYHRKNIHSKPKEKNKIKRATKN